MARVRGTQVQGQTKIKKENRYVIKVMSSNREGCVVPLVRENQRMHRDFSLDSK
jgi:hypothetical protein